MIPKLAMTYVVSFPDAGVVKVGRAWKMSRIRSLLRAGGQIVMLLEHTPIEVERALLTVFKSRFFRAFQSESDARWLLPGGRGFTECFMAGAAERAAVMDAITEGLRNGYDEAAHDPGRALAAVEVGISGPADPADVDRPASIGGRPRPRPGRTAADQGGHLPARRGGHGRRDLGARPGPRRRGVPHAVPGRHGHVLPGRELAQGRPAQPVGHPTAASGAARERFRIGSGTVPGSRGRETRESERARRERRGWRGGLRYGSGIRRGTSTVLHRPPERNHRPLPGLWPCPPAPLAVLADAASIRELTWAIGRPRGSR